MNRTAESALAAVVLLAGVPAHAAAITADVTGCVLMTCTVEPTGGPVALDPNGFTLDVDWMPKHVALFGLDAGDWFALGLDFTFTGTHDGRWRGLTTWGTGSCLPMPARYRSDHHRRRDCGEPDEYV